MSQNPLFWWKPKKNLIDRLLFKRQKLNAGDVLSEVIVKEIIRRQKKDFFDHNFEGNKLLALGSVLHFAESGDVIWGTGVNGKVLESLHVFDNLDVRAVRGPKTRDYLKNKKIDVPAVYGDPAVLLPELFSDFNRIKKNKEVLVIPHMYEVDELKTKFNILSPLVHWRKFVSEIVSAEFVISSSLHGIIVAEAFGIPAVRLKITNTESDFKYDDYYLGSGRESHKIIYSVEEVNNVGHTELPIYQKEKLLSAFPFDKWN